MADTGFKTTGTVVSDAWTIGVTTTRINTSDDSRCAAQGTSFLAAVLSTYGFSVPSGATIDGIEVLAEISSTTGGVLGTFQASLSWDGGSSYTATKSDTSNVTSDANKTLGGPTDTWGRTWSTTELSDSNFRAKIEGKSAGSPTSVRLDYLAIKVYYTEATGGTGHMIFTF